MIIATYCCQNANEMQAVMQAFALPVKLIGMLVVQIIIGKKPFGVFYTSVVSHYTSNQHALSTLSCSLNFGNPKTST